MKLSKLHYSVYFSRETENNEKWCILIRDIARHCISCNSLGAFVVSYSAPEGYMPENEVYGKRGFLE